MKKVILLLMVISINSIIDLTAQSPQKYCAPVTLNPQPNVEKATFDQTDIKSYYINYQNSFADEFDGSYQIIISGHIKMIISTETLNLIKLNREKTSEKTIDISPGIKIRILSEKSVRTKKTIPLNQLFIIE